MLGCVLRRQQVQHFCKIGFDRICRCTPLGTSGIDIVCEELPPEGSWYKPWAWPLARRESSTKD